MTLPDAGTPPKAVITTIHAVWKGEMRYEVGPPGGPRSMIDAASKLAPGPVETLLSAAATCAAVDVVDILAKRRTPIASLEIRVTAERRPRAPRRVRRLELEFRIDGSAIDPEQAERAIELSVEKYCSVISSLAPDIVLHTRLVLNGRSFDAVRRTMFVDDGD